MLIGRYTDYRDFLKYSLELRIQKNPKYSLRAFARDLDVAPQVLSSVFNKKKGISTEVATKISFRLNLNEQETNYFCDLVDLAHARSGASRKIAALRLTRYKRDLKFQTVKDDAFRVISDWYHYAILELTFVEGFISDISWIAKRLQISNHETKQAVERLKRLDLLIEKNSVFKKTETNLTTSHDIPSEAIQKFNRQILHKAA
ncbi:MAG: TIGR02147 family protein, partial [Pseudobdellovibrionaceae bacterium]